jgi:hypothetical protein
MNNIPTHPLQTNEWGEFRKEWGNTTLWYKDFLIIFSNPITGFDLLGAILIFVVTVSVTAYKLRQKLLSIKK